MKRLQLATLFLNDVILIFFGFHFGKLLWEGVGRSYNEQYRFFDALRSVVYHDQTLSVYAFLLVITFVLFILNGILMAKTFKKSQVCAADPKKGEDG